MVINGRRDGVGADRRELQSLIAAGDRGPGGPAVTIRGASVAISAGPPRKAADVWLVRYDPRIVQVPIKRGENGGRTLPHRNIVRQLTRLGSWAGRPETLPIPPAADPDPAHRDPGPEPRRRPDPRRRQGLTGPARLHKP